MNNLDVVVSQMGNHANGSTNVAHCPDEVIIAASAAFVAGFLYMVGTAIRHYHNPYFHKQQSNRENAEGRR